MSGSNHTPVSMAQIKAALQFAWPTVIGGDAPDVAVQLLTAQIALETGNGQALMGYNVGNFKSVQGAPGAITFQTFEYDAHGNRITVPAGAAGAWFRSWPSLEEGVAAYLSAMRTRWSAAWSYVLDGDTQGFAKTLHDHGYFTADPQQYAAGMIARGAPATKSDEDSNPGSGEATFSNDDGNEPQSPG